MTHTIKSATRLLALPIVSAAIVACHDAYDALFLDPDRSTTARIEYLFTQGLLDSDFPIHYGEWYWQVYDNVAAWAQVSGTVNDVHMMQPVSDQWQNTWTDYYTRAAMDVREIRVIYDRLPADQKASYEVYLHLGKVVNAFTTARTTDLWGDMPSSEAFTARQTTGRNLFPKFDTQESVYDAILKDLKDASDALRSLTVVHPALATQDLLLKGDLTGWRRFANSLRLRLAMRLSEVAPAKAQAIVQEILADSTTYPLVETNAQNVAWYMDPTWIYDHNSLGNRSRATSERGPAGRVPERARPFGSHVLRYVQPQQRRHSQDPAPDGSGDERVQSTPWRGLRRHPPAHRDSKVDPPRDRAALRGMGRAAAHGLPRTTAGQHRRQTAGADGADRVPFYGDHQQQPELRGRAGEGHPHGPRLVGRQVRITA